ncbi:hypothetical protein QBC38DRAFT_531108 [Podospora fimiseda]|uniref:NAD dependent epimerase/dehydratase n=1 Tax=Podospora fimiseda TaxID=252190 RepID=A0AAN7GYV0_9PEZI|nr:hypothetical protein QBC38DRAFT_531108 [Podospora fimiseda]
MSSPTTAANRPPPGGLKIIHASLFRMGTKSFAQAYSLLNFSVHQGLLEDVTESPWTDLERAAEATWGSFLPLPLSYPPRGPFTRSDWDSGFGQKYDVATDLASPFVIELIKSYPEAKVVIVQRPFEKWWPSFKAEVLDKIGWYIIGIRAVQAMEKMMYGFFGAQVVKEIEEKKRMVYDEYFAEIRRIVPENQRLEYKMGDGWEPLCEFLGVPVPEGVDFPFANEKELHRVEVKKRKHKFYLRAAKVFGPWVVLGGAIVAGWKWSGQIY